MLSKETACCPGKTRWMAGTVGLALIVVGLYFVRAPRSHATPKTPAPPSAPARIHPASPAEQSRVAATFGQLPLWFEPNQGQTDPQVRFTARGDRYALFLTSTRALLSLSSPTTYNPRLRTPAGKDARV